MGKLEQNTTLFKWKKNNDAGLTQLISPTKKTLATGLESVYTAVYAPPYSVQLQPQTFDWHRFMTNQQS